MQPFNPHLTAGTIEGTFALNLHRCEDDPLLHCHTWKAVATLNSFVVIPHRVTSSERDEDYG